MFVRWWPLEFIASYIPQILISTWVYLMVYATVATWYAFIYDARLFVEKVGRTSLSALVLSMVAGVFVFSYSINIVTPLDINDELSFRSDRLTVGTFNKLYRSQNFASDAELITATKVDVFSLQEVSETDINLIKERVNHDFSYITDCNCSASETEVGLVSKYPITNALTIYEDENAVIARTLIDSEEHGEFVVYLVHMHVPYIQSSYEQRDDALRLLSDAMNSEVLPTFAVGDFNTTVFSPDMREFMDNTRASQNVVSRSWPECSWFGTPVGELACARIDYVFVPRDAVVYSLEIGDESYSDHRSVITEVTL